MLLQQRFEPFAGFYRCDRVVQTEDYILVAVVHARRTGDIHVAEAVEDHAKRDLCLYQVVVRVGYQSGGVTQNVPDSHLTR